MTTNPCRVRQGRLLHRSIQLLDLSTDAEPVVFNSRRTYALAHMREMSFSYYGGNPT